MPYYRDVDMPHNSIETPCKWQDAARGGYDCRFDRLPHRVGARRAGRPLVVGGYGCRADILDPGRAARWMRDAFSHVLSHDVVCKSCVNSRQNSPEGTCDLRGRRAEVFRTLLARAEVARP